MGSNLRFGKGKKKEESVLREESLKGWKKTVGRLNLESNFRGFTTELKMGVVNSN